jgi:vacuolar protein sorting-associated protein 29
MLVPGKMQHCLCTGNLTSLEVLEMLRSLSPSLHVVRGEYDEQLPGESAFPECKVIGLSSFKIGIINGSTTITPPNDIKALAIKARELDVDILVSGGTHKVGIVEEDGRWYINPGSITGAFSPIAFKGVRNLAASTSEEGGAEVDQDMGEDGGEVKPSFVLLAVQGGKVVCYCYEYNKEKDTLEVSKTEFSK